MQLYRKCSNYAIQKQVSSDTKKASKKAILKCIYVCQDSAVFDEQQKRQQLAESMLLCIFKQKETRYAMLKEA